MSNLRYYASISTPENEDVETCKDSSSTKELYSPIQMQTQEPKSSKLSLLNPFHRKRKSVKKEEEFLRLKEAIEQMEKTKQKYLEELEAQGKKPNTGTSWSYGTLGIAAAAAGVGAGGCC